MAFFALIQINLPALETDRTDHSSIIFPRALFSVLIFSAQSDDQLSGGKDHAMYSCCVMNMG